MLTLLGCADTKFTPFAVSPDLPDWPAECSQPTPHAALRPGTPVLSLLARERFQLDVANKTQAACAAFYGDLKTNFAGGAPQ